MIGCQIHDFAKKLWPLNRSVTGEGVRETLMEINKLIPSLKVQTVPSGAKVFDWVIPKEWKVREAYLITPSGEKNM